jgi:glycosyltransferase involved in cell wall biosynthesis
MPKVTVITPNYNYGRYLPQRLDSILAQTLRDFELIILDDASTDNSRQVIECYLHDPRVQTVFNEQNSGSVFKQWNLGLRQATGEYVWIAEADDFAEPMLLETLVDRLDRYPNVGLAMSQSWIVDEDGRAISVDKPSAPFQSHGADSTDDIFHWHEDFIASGRDFCLQCMYKYNHIPNASAVVFRRSVLEAVNGATEDMQLCGDYMTYVKILERSDIASVGAHLNYFRFHPTSTRARTSSLVFLREIRDVQRRINDHFQLGERDRYYQEALPAAVASVIGPERRPPFNKVPTRKALKLLLRFAREDNRAFHIALRTLAREQAADVARRLRLLGFVRAVTNAVRAPPSVRP